MASIESIDFRNISIFQGLSDLSLARLIPNFELLELRPGEVLCRQGEVGDALFILVEGEVSVSVLGSNGEKKEIDSAGPHDVIGEMALLSESTRSATAIAITNIIALRLRKERFDELTKKHISLLQHLNKLLVNRIRKGNLLEQNPQEEYSSIVTSPNKNTENEPKKALTQIFTLDSLGWLLCLVIPTLIIYFGEDLNLKEEQAYFLSIFIVMVLMWIFNLTDDYVPGFFALLVPLAMGLAPPSFVLSGFASDSFFMAMSFLGLGTVLIASGLSYRILLIFLLRLPNRQFWHNFGLLLMGIFLTPMLPSANGRVVLLGPFAADMMEILHFKPGGSAATRIAISAFTGASLMSPIFMNSKSLNFVVLGLLSPQLQDQMHWVNWFLEGAVTGLIMLLLYLITMSIIFSNKEVPRPSKDAIYAQLALLGKLNSKEWGAIMAIMIAFVGIATVSLHKVQTPWVGLTVLCVLLILGTLGKNEFRKNIDWSFMIYLAEMVGIVKVFDYLKLDKWISNGFIHIGVDYYLEGNLVLFISVICLLILVLRLFLPTSASIVLLAAIFIPLAEEKGINSWLVGFIILVLGEMWIFPYQCTYYLQLQEQNRSRQLYHEKSFLKFNLLMNLLKISAIYASIPYWKYLELL